MPSVASPAKLERIRAYGAELVVGGERYADALAASEACAARIRRAAGARLRPGRDAARAGHASASSSRQDAPDIDTLLVAVGGGGLIGGIAAWYGGRVRIVGVEPEAAPTLHMALAAGEPVDAPAGGIAADSLAPRRVGALMFPIAQAHVERVVLVDRRGDRATRSARCGTRLRLVGEPGGAAAFAALLSGRYAPAPGERVGVLLCGGNTTAVDFGR